MAARIFTATLPALLSLAALATVLTPGPAESRGMKSTAGVSDSIVFVSRQILTNGSIYWSVPKDMPGVGPHSRFRNAAPGKLLVLRPDGSIRTLIDGANPNSSTLSLIDVNAPDVSYDGTTIVFAGIPVGTGGTDPVSNPNAWRIYSIRADGSGLRQITSSDYQINLAGLPSGLAGYDDTDPAWLPDGRIVFTSTRWPSFGQYSGVRTSNLYVVNADGSKLHRITSERNGADRAMVDPLTGKIVYSRWWRNHRFALNDMSTVAATGGGYVQKDGLSSDRTIEMDGSAGFADYLWRNDWFAATINPDGTGLALWNGGLTKGGGLQIYGGGFTSAGDLYANYFPMGNMTEASGFGGIRRYHRGTGRFESLAGITSLTLDYVNATNPTSFGIFKGSYASEPEPLPDGRVLISWAADVNQDYGLYTVNADGNGLTLLHDNPGTSEIRARLIRPRPLPPVIPDAVTDSPSLLPPPAAGPYNGDGTFTFDDLNVYFNAPVDSEIASAIPVGSASKIRFFIDQQRTSPGSFPPLDWPILLHELAVGTDGSLKDATAPANVPLFEQIRTSDNRVPLTGGPFPSGAAHVAGMNFGRPGVDVRCVGCHAGHSMIPVPVNPADAQWTNLAPGAAVTVSSTRDATYNGGLIDRQVMKGEIWRYWTSTPGQNKNQWATLTFPVPVIVKTVRLYSPRQGDVANSTLKVFRTTVTLFADAQLTSPAGSAVSGAIAVTGTDVSFNSVAARAVRVSIDSVTGTFYGAAAAGLAEIEVIAKANGVATGSPLSSAPRDFTLEQNYPNPFNPSTVIRYSVPKSSQVTLSVYTMLGQKIADLVKDAKEPGTYEVRFDGSGLASGVYFYRLQAGEYLDSKKLLLIR